VTDTKTFASRLVSLAELVRSVRACLWCASWPNIHVLSREWITVRGRSASIPARRRTFCIGLQAACVLVVQMSTLNETPLASSGSGRPSSGAVPKNSARAVFGELEAPLSLTVSRVRCQRQLARGALRSSTMAAFFACSGTAFGPSTYAISATSDERRRLPPPLSKTNL